MSGEPLFIGSPRAEKGRTDDIIIIIMLVRGNRIKMLFFSTVFTKSPQVSLTNILAKGIVCNGQDKAYIHLFAMVPTKIYCVLCSNPYSLQAQ